MDTAGVDRYVFEDDLMRIVWLFTASQASFDLLNKTTHSMKVQWDEAAYMDEDGNSHRVMHAGVKYSQRDAPQPPTVVVRGGRISDIVYPTSYVSYTSGNMGAGMRSRCSALCEHRHR